MRLIPIIASFVALSTVKASPMPSAQGECATCPQTDLAGNAIVANSGGTLGVPKFCGYSADATGASGPQVICFYSNSGDVFSSSNELCPLTTSLATCSVAT